jgi:hypothetical protein
MTNFQKMRATAYAGFENVALKMLLFEPGTGSRD